MPEPGALHHISSAVVTVVPARREAVADAIARLPETEVHHRHGSKIVVVLEGPDSDVIGGRLALISQLDGVLSATLVYEQIEPLDSLGAAP